MSRHGSDASTPKCLRYSARTVSRLKCSPPCSRNPWCSEPGPPTPTRISTGMSGGRGPRRVRWPTTRRRTARANGGSGDDRNGPPTASVQTVVRYRDDPLNLDSSCVLYDRQSVRDCANRRTEGFRRVDTALTTVYVDVIVPRRGNGRPWPSAGRSPDQCAQFFSIRREVRLEPSGCRSAVRRIRRISVVTKDSELLQVIPSFGLSRCRARCRTCDPVHSRQQCLRRLCLLPAHDGERRIGPGNLRQPRDRPGRVRRVPGSARRCVTRTSWRPCASERAGLVGGSGKVAAVRVGQPNKGRP